MLGCLKVRGPALHLFADVFQGCYKNRTDGTNDYKYFAAFYFILHIIILLVNISVHLNSFVGFLFPLPLFITVFIIGSLLFALLHPYKKSWLNIPDSLFLPSLGLQYRDTKTVDSIGRISCSTTIDVLCCVCSMQASFMVGNTSEMSTKVKKHLPVPETKVAKS